MDDPTLSVEAQLAVLRTKMDELIRLNQSRGEDHETRIRYIERTYVREAELDRRFRRVLTVVATMCSVVTAAGVVINLIMR